MTANVEIMAWAGGLELTKRAPWWLFGVREQDLVDGRAYTGLDGAVGTFVGDRAATAAEMIRLAGMEWEVEAMKAGWFDSSPLEGDAGWIIDPNQFSLIRTDTRAKLGTVTGQYHPYQNREIFEFMDSICGEFGAKYHSAGVLEAGAKVWVLAQLPGEITVGRMSGKTNTHLPFLLVLAGHDGRTGIQLMPTDIRVECANTAGFAVSKAERDRVCRSIAHKANAREKLEVAAATLAEIPELMATREALLSKLARQPMDLAEFIDFATGMYVGVDEADPKRDELVEEWFKHATPRSQTIFDTTIARQRDAFLSGMGNEGNSAYDALQAITETVDHKTPHDTLNKAQNSTIGVIAETEGDDVRLHVRRQLKAAKKVASAQGIVRSSWLGDGADAKRDAIERLTKRVALVK